MTGPDHVHVPSEEAILPEWGKMSMDVLSIWHRLCESAKLVLLCQDCGKPLRVSLSIEAA